MKKALSPGRPVLSRNVEAGNHLKTALKLLGKTWRLDTGSPNHVLRWGRWLDCGLPRSATTIDRDMRDGVPTKRMGAYARCLGLSPEALAAPDTDMVKALSAPAMLLGHWQGFSEQYLEQNRERYISRLFDVMQGVYRMHFIIPEVEGIQCGSLWIHTAESHHIKVAGRFLMFGIETAFSAYLFRWHNNLHIHYLCDDSTEWGYVMFVDPLRHHLLRSRTPFRLSGKGLTDTGLAGNIPIAFSLCMEKRPQAQTPPDALFRREENALRKNPSIVPGDPDYETLRAKILTPDILG